MQSIIRNACLYCSMGRWSFFEKKVHTQHSFLPLNTCAWIESCWFMKTKANRRFDEKLSNNENPCTHYHLVQRKTIRMMTFGAGTSCAVHNLFSCPYMTTSLDPRSVEAELTSPRPLSLTSLLHPWKAFREGWRRARVLKCTNQTILRVGVASAWY